jgi:transposase
MYMSTKHCSLSPQALKRLQGGELILKGYDNETIADIVQVTPRSVSNWRNILKDHNDDLCALVRKQGSGRTPRLTLRQKPILDVLIQIGSCVSICHLTHRS